MLFSDTCEPIANRRFNCFSIRLTISWSSSDVNPSAPIHQYKQSVKLINSNSLSQLPDKLPVIAASRVETWKILNASSTCTSVAKDCSCILAIDSDNRMTASNCLRYKKKKKNQDSASNNTQSKRKKKQTKKTLLFNELNQLAPDVLQKCQIAPWSWIGIIIFGVSEFDNQFRTITWRWWECSDVSPIPFRDRERHCASARSDSSASQPHSAIDAVHNGWKTSNLSINFPNYRLISVVMNTCDRIRCISWAGASSVHLRASLPTSERHSCGYPSRAWPKSTHRKK